MRASPRAVKEAGGEQRCYSWAGQKEARRGMEASESEAVPRGPRGQSQLEVGCDSDYSISIDKRIAALL